MPHVHNRTRIKRMKYFPSEMGKTNFLSLYVFDTNLLNFCILFFFKGLLMLSFVLFTFFFLTIILYFVYPKKIACLLKGKIEGKKIQKPKKKKKKMWRASSIKHLFELLVTAIACVQRYIFYEKKAKTKKIILTPCAIKLSFIFHGFCRSQPQPQQS